MVLFRGLHCWSLASSTILKVLKSPCNILNPNTTKLNVQDKYSLLRLLIVLRLSVLRVVIYSSSTACLIDGLVTRLALAPRNFVLPRASLRFLCLLGLSSRIYIVRFVTVWPPPAICRFGFRERGHQNLQREVTFAKSLRYAANPMAEFRELEKTMPLATNSPSRQFRCYRTHIF